MTISALRSVPKEKRSSVLSSVSRFLLPTPQQEHVELSPIEQDVINELGRSFGFSGLSIPENKLSAVQKRVFHELSALLTVSPPKQIRARIGQQGVLPPTLYDIDFAKAYVEKSAGMGVSKDLAELVIRHAEAIQHVFPEKHGISGTPSSSLFTKAHPQLSECLVLVLTDRRESRLTVESAWLVFNDLVGIVSSDTPLETLEKFSLHYGVDIQVGDQVGKFFWLTEVRGKVGEQNSFLRIAPSSSHEPADVRFSFSFDGLGGVRIALAFAINILNYVSDLRRKGINVSRKILPAGGHFDFELTQSDGRM